MKLALILLTQRCVRVDNSNQLHIMLLRKRLQKPGNMPMFQPHNHNARRWFILRSCKESCGDKNREEP